jgi:hypothetical protein
MGQTTPGRGTSSTSLTSDPICILAYRRPTPTFQRTFQSSNAAYVTGEQSAQTSIFLICPSKRLDLHSLPPV